MLRFRITQVCRHLRLSRNHARFPMNVAVHVPVTEGSLENQFKPLNAVLKVLFGMSQAMNYLLLAD